jgi:uncharacterized protein
MTDNVATIRSAFTAFAQGDMDTLKKVFAPGIVWREPGRSSISGEYQGLDATLGFFGQLFERSGGTFKAELLECGEIAPDHVACVINVSGDMSDRFLDQRSVLLFQQHSGRTVEVRNFSSDQYAQDAFWGPATVALPDAHKATTPVTT